MAYLIISSNIKHQASKVLEVVNSLSGRIFQTIEEIENHPEIVVRGISKNEKLGIEDLKELQQKMIYKPMDLIKQIAIIFNSQKMTSEAQNAMLKTLEDHSEWCEYIIVVDNEENLMSTILSRCQKIYEHRTSEDQASNIKHQVLTEESEKSKSVSYIQELLNSTIPEQFKFVEEVIEKEFKSTRVQEGKVTSKIKDQTSSDQNIPTEDEGISNLPESVDIFLEDLSNYLRKELSKGIIQKNRATENKVQTDIQKVATTKIRIDANTNKRLALENLMLQLKQGL